MRWLVCLVFGVTTASTACTRSTAPKARLVGEIASLAGVAGVITSACLTSVWGDAKKSVAVFAIGMGAGMATYAVGELTDPANDETPAQRNHRWAQLLTDQARDAARDHRCPEVRGLAARIQGYDPAVHAEQLMRDPAVQQCLSGPAALSAPPAAPGSR